MLIYPFFKDLINIKFNYDIGKKTWFGTGGKAKILLVINNLKSLQFILKILPKSHPIFLIGAGSNVIVRDGGINGITIKLGCNLAIQQTQAPRLDFYDANSIKDWA